MVEEIFPPLVPNASRSVNKSPQISAIHAAEGDTAYTVRYSRRFPMVGERKVPADQSVLPTSRARRSRDADGVRCRNVVALRGSTHESHHQVDHDVGRERHTVPVLLQIAASAA
jgi:hypothetical protein